MRPMALMSPVWAMPTMMVESKRGTMSPLISEMKALDRKWNSS